MGHNVDLTGFGMCSIRCVRCGKDLDLSEVDIDCDLTSHCSMSFELSLQCYKCQKENIKKFRIIQDD